MQTKEQRKSAAGLRTKRRAKNVIQQRPTKGKAPTAVKRKSAKKKVVKKKLQRAGKGLLPKVKVEKKKAPAPKGKKKAIPEAARKLTPSAAVKAFDQAVSLFYHHDFESARRAFTNFIHQFHQETEMVARARTYVTICAQRLSHPPSLPRDAEALYDRGIIELNSGRILEAISYFEKALKYEPDAPHIIYSLAAAHSRLGSIEKALEELKKAVGLREVLRIQARRDSDFVNLYTHPGFQELVGWELVEEPAPLPHISES